MPTGYIPRGDGAFDAWQANFQAYVDAHCGELGLPSDVPTRRRWALDPSPERKRVGLSANGLPTKTPCWRLGLGITPADSIMGPRRTGGATMTG